MWSLYKSNVYGVSFYCKLICRCPLRNDFSSLKGSLEKKKVVDDATSDRMTKGIKLF